MKNYRLILLCLGITLLIWALWIGYTWHMIPVYACICIAALATATAKSIIWKKLLTGSVLFLSGLSLALLYLFPFVELPEPSGSYGVGVTYKKFITDRDETFTRKQGDTRLLYLKVWWL